MFTLNHTFLLNQQTVPLKGTIQQAKTLAKNIKKTEIIS